MIDVPFRAVAILKAKVGQEQALLDFTLQAMALIRKVDGLRKVEVSHSVSDPGRLVLYYWWESPGHSDCYLAGPVYAKVAPGLEALVQEHSLVLAEMISGQ